MAKLKFEAQPYPASLPLLANTPSPLSTLPLHRPSPSTAPLRPPPAQLCCPLTRLASAARGGARDRMVADLRTVGWGVAWSSFLGAAWSSLPGASF
jgi:hypothetical protein